MRFKSDSQRKAMFYNMSHRFSSRPEIHADPALFKNVKKEDLQFLDYPEEVYKMRIKRKPGVVKADDSNFAVKPFPENEVYNLWDSGIPIPEVAKSFGISESSVKTILTQYAVDPAVIGYNPRDYVEYLREMKGYDISINDGEDLIGFISNKDYRKGLDLVASYRNKVKKNGSVKDDDERSEDYVSKGDFSHRPETITKFSKKDKGFSETIDGYECDYCGCEFSSKVGAKVHASSCDEKGLQDELDGDDDSGKDTFFNGDDGDPTN